MSLYEDPRPQEPEGNDEADDDPEAPGEHDAHLMDDEDESAEPTVSCVHCLAEIPAYAGECPQCGHAFENEAWQEEPRAGFPGWVGPVGIAALIGALIYAFL